MTLSHKKPKLNTIINFAERLIEARHPASDDLQVFIRLEFISEFNEINLLLIKKGIYINSEQ